MHRKGESHSGPRRHVRDPMTGVVYAASFRRHYKDAKKAVRDIRRSH